ncbi:MAG: NADP-dependent oxidoreductase [Spirochaetota bacterium]
MRAMVIREFGGPEVFERREVSDPRPDPDQVLVEVRATSVNPVDFKTRQRGGWDLQPPAILGWDAAGVVREAGSRVTGLKPGDEVFYTPPINGRGTYAELHAVPAEVVSMKPSNLTFQEAAAVPLAGSTAWDALVERARVLPGERVLIHGAGGVGSLGIQIAKAAGAWVAVTCGDYDFDLARELGADLTIDYRSQDFTGMLDPESVDVVFDTVGGDLLARSAPLVRRGGRMAVIVGHGGDFGRTYHRNITLHMVLLSRSRRKMELLRNLIERGGLRPVIDSVMDLEEVAEAHRRLERGRVRGKIVLRVRD